MLSYDLYELHFLFFTKYPITYVYIIYYVWDDNSFFFL